MVHYVCHEGRMRFIAISAVNTSSFEYLLVTNATYAKIKTQLNKKTKELVQETFRTVLEL